MTCGERECKMGIVSLVQYEKGLIDSQLQVETLVHDLLAVGRVA